MQAATRLLNLINAMPVARPGLSSRSAAALLCLNASYRRNGVVRVAVHAAATPDAEQYGIPDVLVQTGINVGALERLTLAFSNEITLPIRNSPIYQ